MTIKVYFWLSIGAAVALLALSWSVHPVSDWLVVGLLAATAVIADSMAFQLPVHGSVSLAFAATYAALLYGGPTAAALTAILGSVSAADIRAKKPLIEMAFNGAQLAISTLTAATVYLLLGGRSLVAGPVQPVLPAELLAALIAASCFFAVNILMVGTAVSLGHGIRLRQVFRQQGFSGYWISLVVLALLGLVMAHLLALQSWIGLLLLVLPFMAARRTFRVYAELAEAYTSTVRSLVTAIEAKDPYTRGHSERVAVYARRLGMELQLSRTEVELLERAALLHDVGKIGIPLGTLTSPLKLTSSEAALVRQHPDKGGALVSDVEFLSDVVPIVRHHHERIDGSGYPDGLSGDSIPLLARILAVADSYDAMTSDRAYRLGMPKAEAIVELKRVAGSQLDHVATSAFISALQREATEAP